MHLIERAAERMRRSGPPAAPPIGAAPPIVTEDRPAAPVTEALLAPPLLPSEGRVTMARLEEAGLAPMQTKGRTRVTEEFRIAVSRLLRTISAARTEGKASANLVMVTSSRPGEGKTFSALNLAGSFARAAKRRVLLVDTDTKQKSLSFQLGLADRPGFLDLADPGRRVADLIVPTDIPQLDLLPVGIPAGTGSAAHSGTALDATVHRIEQALSSHIIVLDTAPCLSTSDASAFAHAVGQIVMVVEAERTQRSELEASIDLVKICPSIVLLLNKMKSQMTYRFGAYYGLGNYE